MRTVAIPGGTATFRDPEELSPRQRNLIKAVAMAAAGAIEKVNAVLEPEREGESKEDKAAREKRNEAAVGRLDLSVAESMKLIQMREATVVATLASWSLDRPLPTLDTLADLPNDLYDALDAAIGGMSGGAHVDFSPGPPEEAVPTGPSSGSAGSLREPIPANP